MKGLDLAIDICHIASASGKVCYINNSDNFDIICNGNKVAKIKGYKICFAADEKIKKILNESNTKFSEENGYVWVSSNVSKKILSDIFKITSVIDNKNA